MSNDQRDCVPIKTQIRPSSRFSWSQYQNITKIPPLMVVYIPEKLTERQEDLMKRCQTLLEHSVHHSLVQLIRHADQIRSLSLEQRNVYFIIPEEENNVIRKIRDRFPNSGKIYLPRAVIGALCHYHIQLPSRSFIISLSMHECHVFLSIGYKVHSKDEEKKKELERQQIGKRILEMGGHIVPKWAGQEAINVLVTDSASSKHCLSAFKENIPVVSRCWVDDTYECEKTQEFNDDEQHFNALSTVEHYKIRPFFGLHFKITLNDAKLQKEAKNLIIENQGQIVYGDELCLTHIVRQEKDIKNQQLQTYQSQGKKNLHFVGPNWLRTCAHEGRCIGLKDFRLMAQQVKRERISPERTISAATENSFTSSPSGSCEFDLTPPLPDLQANDENLFNQAMPPPLMPPPSVQKNKQQQQQQQQLASDSMSDDMILKSLFHDQQTVHASTQIRCLPDPELQIEQICEPSQQLFWNDARNS